MSGDGNISESGGPQEPKLWEWGAFSTINNSTPTIFFLSSLSSCIYKKESQGSIKYSGDHTEEGVQEGKPKKLCMKF